MSSKSCSNCGNPIEINARYCSHCGTLQKATPTFITTNILNNNSKNISKSYPTSSPSKSRIIKLIAITEIVIGILNIAEALGIGYMFYIINKNGINLVDIIYGNYISSKYNYILNMNLINIFVILILVFPLLTSLPTIIFGIGLYKFRSWGRKGSMIIGSINLIIFPLGTVFGAIMLYLLTHPEHMSFFDQKTVHPLNTPISNNSVDLHINTPAEYPTIQLDLKDIRMVALLEATLGIIILFVIVLLIVVVNFLFSRYATTNYQIITGKGYIIHLQSLIPFLYAFTSIGIIYASCSLIFGVGLYKLRNWGRIGSMIVSCFSLLSFPLGTIYGGVMLYLLTRPENKLLFIQKSNFPMHK